MNTYGHPHSGGRAYDGGYDGYDSYQDYEDTYAADSPPAASARFAADAYPEDPYARTSSGRATASVGAASAGRARVSPPTDQPRPRYNWSSGDTERGAAGRASVPVSPAVGAATGRATVRPTGPAAPAGPGGPVGPAGTRPGSGGPGPQRPAAKKKRHWLRNSLLISLAVMVITAGGGMVGLSYYVDSAPRPEALALEEGSTIYFSNGKKRMATLQEVNRRIIDTTVPELENVRNAVIAAEDEDFYSHSGVDFMGIARAAWGNATGGTRSGASTIDQQYTRAAAELTEDSYSRKLKEAAMAYKLNQEYTKDEILDFYLNTIYLGRGAYGIQAAADAYFGKPAKELTAGEAALIAGIIRLPDDGNGLSPYDPMHSPDDQQVALERWNYVLDQMVGMGALDTAARAELTELPEVVDPPSPDEPLKGRNGTIIKQVQYELEEMGITDAATGGYRITTTIDPQIQKAALDAARRGNKADYWGEFKKNVKAAIVAVDPADGAVLAYYGGTDDGTGIDLAGPNYDPQTGDLTKSGWPPGSTSKIYTLVAELREGISFDSRWDSCPELVNGVCQYKVDYLEDPIINAGRGASNCDGQGPRFCSLRSSTVQSLNVPFFQFSEAVPNHEGPAKILQAAKDAGITMIQDNDDAMHDVAGSDVSEIAPKYVDHQVAFGQYPVTVLDHANGVATIAAGGLYHKAHFVKSVEQKIDGEWVQVAGDKIKGEQRVEQPVAQAITGVLSTIPGTLGFGLEGGRPAAAKTGTWEHLNQDGFVDGNADAWVVGYTPKLAAAVWTGNPKRKAITDVYGNPVASSGSQGLPAFIWKQFMEQAHAAKEYEPEQFPEAPRVGEPQHPYATGVEPAPEEPEDDDRFCFGFFCDDDEDDGDGGDGDAGNGNGDQNGGTIVPGPGG